MLLVGKTIIVTKKKEYKPGSTTCTILEVSIETKKKKCENNPYYIL